MSRLKSRITRRPEPRRPSSPVAAGPAGGTPPNSPAPANPASGPLAERAATNPAEARPAAVAHVPSNPLGDVPVVDVSTPDSRSSAGPSTSSPKPRVAASSLPTAAPASTTQSAPPEVSPKPQLAAGYRRSSTVLSRAKRVLSFRDQEKNRQKQRLSRHLHEQLYSTYSLRWPDLRAWLETEYPDCAFPGEENFVSNKIDCRAHANH